MPLRRWGKPVQFPVQSKGEWLAILRLKAVSTTPLKRPDCLTRALSLEKVALRGSPSACARQQQ